MFILGCVTLAINTRSRNLSKHNFEASLDGEKIGRRSGTFCLKKEGRGCDKKSVPKRKWDAHAKKEFWCCCAEEWRSIGEGLTEQRETFARNSRSSRFSPEPNSVLDRSSNIEEDCEMSETTYSMPVGTATARWTCGGPPPFVFRWSSSAGGKEKG